MIVENNNLTFEDLFVFVMRNKKDKVFKAMSGLQIATLLKRALDENCLWYKEVDGKITGIILAEIDHDRKLCFIKENLALTLANLREFASRARKEFYGYSFHWYKNGRYYTMPSYKFFKHLGV